MRSEQEIVITRIRWLRSQDDLFQHGYVDALTWVLGGAPPICQTIWEKSSQTPMKRKKQERRTWK